MSMILALRIKGTLNGSISSSQTAFVPVKQILDEVLVLNEIIDQDKKGNKECMMLKVDFQ